MQCIQSLDTSGARAAETFVVEGIRYLAVPQLATDIAGQPASMLLGNSDTRLQVLRWDAGRFVDHATLDVPGGEDAEFFTIGDRRFLATASLRSGAGPYDMAPGSTIFEWRAGRFEPFQRVPTIAAKQWKHFRIGTRDFLGLAQGAEHHVLAEDAPGASCIFEWDGERFVPFQAIASGWGYNWACFQAGDHTLLAYADHVAPSRILNWDGRRFEPFQQLERRSGRAFRCFEVKDTQCLAFARLLEDSAMLRWNGERFETAQVLGGTGGREFLWLPQWRAGRLLRVNFLRGTREQPQTQQPAHVLRLDHGRWEVEEELAASGAVDAAAFDDGGSQVLVLAESLSADVRFRTPSRVYRLD